MKNIRQRLQEGGPGSGNFGHGGRPGEVGGSGATRGKEGALRAKAEKEKTHAKQKERTIMGYSKNTGRRTWSTKDGFTKSYKKATGKAPKWKALD